MIEKIKKYKRAIRDCKFIAEDINNGRYVYVMCVYIYRSEETKEIVDSIGQK